MAKRTQNFKGFTLGASSKNPHRQTLFTARDTQLGAGHAFRNLETGELLDPDVAFTGYDPAIDYVPGQEYKPGTEFGYRAPGVVDSQDEMSEFQHLVEEDIANTYPQAKRKFAAGLLAAGMAPLAAGATVAAPGMVGGLVGSEVATSAAETLAEKHYAEEADKVIRQHRNDPEQLDQKLAGLQREASMVGAGVAVAGLLAAVRRNPIKAAKGLAKRLRGWKRGVVSLADEAAAGGATASAGTRLNRIRNWFGSSATRKLGQELTEEGLEKTSKRSVLGKLGWGLTGVAGGGYVASRVPTWTHDLKAGWRPDFTTNAQGEIVAHPENMRTEDQAAFYREQQERKAEQEVRNHEQSLAEAEAKRLMMAQREVRLQQATDDYNAVLQNQFRAQQQALRDANAMLMNSRIGELDRFTERMKRWE